MNTVAEFEREFLKMLGYMNLLSAFEALLKEFIKTPGNEELYQRFLNADEAIFKISNRDGATIESLKNGHCACYKPNYVLTFSISKNFMEIKPTE